LYHLNLTINQHLNLLTKIQNSRVKKQFLRLLKRKRFATLLIDSTERVSYYKYILKYTFITRMEFLCPNFYDSTLKLMKTFFRTQRLKSVKFKIPLYHPEANLIKMMSYVLRQKLLQSFEIDFYPPKNKGHYSRLSKNSTQIICSVLKRLPSLESIKLNSFLWVDSEGREIYLKFMSEILSRGRVLDTKISFWSSDEVEALTKSLKQDLAKPILISLSMNYRAGFSSEVRFMEYLSCFPQLQSLIIVIEKDYQHRIHWELFGKCLLGISLLKELRIKSHYLEEPKNAQLKSSAVIYQYLTGLAKLEILDLDFPYLHQD